VHFLKFILFPTSLVQCVRCTLKLMVASEILISGAGIAGATAAYWLREAGFTVTVVERAPAPRPGGQTVDLRGAGRTVVDRMGLLGQIRARTLNQRGIAWVDASGRHRAEMPVDAFGGRGIVSADEILRGDLGAVLYEATRPGVSYLFDDTITDLRQDPDGVLVSFEKGDPRRFDVVIGADGLHSVVRRLAFGEPTALHPLGMLNAWFTIPADVDLDDWYLMHNAPGGRVVSIRPGRLPGEHKAALSVRSAESFDRGDIGSQLELLERHFADVGWEAPRLLRAARTAPDFYLDSMGQVLLDRWSRGRVVLLGDAGYCPSPLTGLGTSLALVGAYILAGELTAASPDATTATEQDALQGAFDRYEVRMRPYVKQSQELPPGGVDGYAPMSMLRISLGWAAMRWSQRWPLRPMMERAFSKADAIDLPEYKITKSTAAEPTAH
jgi:2-polyprenyl-6-methoxyphenol hydroxylase-like FAD-dependent oxidoreductase